MRRLAFIRSGRGEGVFVIWPEVKKVLPPPFAQRVGVNFVALELNPLTVLKVVVFHKQRSVGRASSYA